MTGMAEAQPAVDEVQHGLTRPRLPRLPLHPRPAAPPCPDAAHTGHPRSEAEVEIVRQHADRRAAQARRQHRLVNNLVARPRLPPYGHALRIERQPGSPAGIAEQLCVTDQHPEVQLTRAGARVSIDCVDIGLSMLP